MGPKEQRLKQLLRKDFRNELVNGAEEIGVAIHDLDNPSAYDLFEYEANVKVFVKYSGLLYISHFPCFCRALTLFLFCIDHQLFVALLRPPVQERPRLPTAGEQRGQHPVEE